MLFRSNKKSLEGIVEYIVENMEEADKANVVNTSEDDLIQFHRGWGTGIRNEFNLHQDRRLLKNLGVDDADDASMLIIKAVWKALRESGEKFLKGKINTDMLTYETNNKCLEIPAGEGRSLVIEGIDYEFAEDLAKSLRLGIIVVESHVADHVAPQVILEKDATIQVWTYPAHPANSE